MNGADLVQDRKGLQKENCLDRDLKAEESQLDKVGGEYGEDFRQREMYLW